MDASVSVGSRSRHRDNEWCQRWIEKLWHVMELQSAFDREAKISGNEYLIDVVAYRLQFS